MHQTEYYTLFCTLSKRITLFTPLGAWAASDAFDDPPLFECAQQVPDHVAADVRAQAFHVRDAEIM